MTSGGINVGCDDGFLERMLNGCFDDFEYGKLLSASSEINNGGTDLRL